MESAESVRHETHAHIQGSRAGYLGDTKLRGVLLEIDRVGLRGLEAGIDLVGCRRFEVNWDLDEGKASVVGSELVV